LSLDEGFVGIVEWSSAMGRMSPHVPISRASRRRLARWLVGSPLRDVERDLVLETLANTRGNRTASARLLGVSVRTLRNKITEYSAQGVEVPPPSSVTALESLDSKQLISADEG
jgi:DNA-binding NtrC family response regulator